MKLCKPKATSPTHTTHKVVVVEKGTSNTWSGSLRLLPCTTFNESFTDDDCSTTDASVDSGDDKGIVYSDKSKGIFSFYQRGDGSENHPDGIPTRYMKMAKNNRDKAFHAMEKTVEWRETEGINEMMNRPHPKFDIGKAILPHYYVGRDVAGHAVYIQQPALLNLKQAKANGLSFDEFLYHSIYVQEYLWQIVEADNPMALITNVIDVGDFTFAQLRKEREVISFILSMCTVFDHHFPMRAHKTIVINAPSWFNMLYKCIKPLLRESTTDLIEICAKGKKQDETLMRLLGEDTSQNLPDCCWSKPKLSNIKFDPTQLPMEKALRDYVMSRNQAGGVEMDPVLDA